MAKTSSLAGESEPGVGDYRTNYAHRCRGRPRYTGVKGSTCRRQTTRPRPRRALDQAGLPEDREHFAASERTGAEAGAGGRENAQVGVAASHADGLHTPTRASVSSARTRAPSKVVLLDSDATAGLDASI
jgi:hypothetical protein